ncbi:hypothetical protein SLEP1_g40032 [Rubroshorea leprosula]|uniref:Wall-associated receptor kinase galacturonan-binding domain-containing protein n=1 Tax=Rubroshorea leprosula TaxID=152421 RepID=A0AAV5L261_9ROSI|nr:hypothetical protein SLEP1_g40032 [Rubroshorea leprosula]
MFVRAKVVVLFGLMALVMSLFPDACMAGCVPSSCGNLTIDFPSRLLSDPNECCFPRSKLVCKNNRTTLPHELSAYQNFSVEEISCENGTVRVVDASLDRNKCSIPYYYPLLKLLCWPDKNGPSFRNITENSIMHVLNCNMPISSPLYVDASNCTNSPSSPHTYFFLFNNQAKLSDFNESCRIEAQFPVMLSNISGLSASDIYSQMLMGFELNYWEWLYNNDPDYCSSVSLLEKM